MLKYFAVVGLYWVFLGVLLIVYGYEGSFQVLNRMNCPVLDYLMYFLTMFGDSLFISSLMVVLFPRRTSFLLILIMTVIITGLLVQAMKQWIFPGWERPLKVFEGSCSVHIVGHYRLYHDSFPSGHSVTTAVAFTVLAWYLRDRKSWVMLSALLAVIVSYTRIYTGSHFPGDVLAGSIMGTILCLFMICFTERKISNWVGRWPEATEGRFGIILQIIAVAGLLVSIIQYFKYLFV